MFTPGFRLFFGIALAGVVATLLFGFVSGDTSGPNYFGVLDRNQAQGIISLGWKGTIGEPIGYIVLLFFTLVAGYFGITLAAFRDADVESVAELDGASDMPPAQRPTHPSYMPVVGALGVGVLITGLVADHSAYWVIGLVMLAVVALEWMMSSWSDRITGDPVAARNIRSRIMAPIEIPVMAIAGVAIAALAISRILLAVSEFSAIWVAGGISVGIMAIAILAIMKPNLGRGAFGAILGVAAVGIIAAGVISAAIGIRDIEHHHEEEEHHEESLVIDE